MSESPMWRRYLRFLGPDARADARDEIEHHLEMRAREYERRGMTPEAARQEALRRFGDPERVRLEVDAEDRKITRGTRRRERWGAVHGDFRFAGRTLRRNPGFTLVAVLTLALGIGANAAIFSVVNAVLLRPLPYADADRLVRVFSVEEGSRSVMSPANFFDIREQIRSLEELSFFTSGSATLTGRGEPVRLRQVEVGANFFQVLRARPALGRAFRPDENEPGTSGVAILSHGIWQQRFGGDPQVIGTRVLLDGQPFEVVGVMPAGFSYPSERDLWTPYEYDAWFTSEESRGGWFLNPIGRVKFGATVEQLDRELTALATRLEQEFPRSNARIGLTAVPLLEVMVGDIRTPLLVLLGAVGLVLLIACANVANLLLARATTREGEFAVRAALGAGRSRLVRLLLAESLLLGLLGGSVGLLLAVWGTKILVSLQPEGIPRLQDVGVDATVIAFTAAVALLTSLLFGLLPASATTRPGLFTALRSGGRGALAGRGSARVRGALVVMEMALAVMLLCGAGLLIRSFVRLQQVDPGFHAQQALSFRLSLPEADYPSDARRATFFTELERRLETLPGVVSVGGVTALPMSGRNFSIALEIEGREPARPGETPTAEIRPATVGYFQTVGIPLLRGRAFTQQDRGASSVLMISEEAARRLFAGEDPLGRRIDLSWGRDSVIDGEVVGAKEVGGEVIGIVGDVRQFGLERELEPTIYLPHAQVPENTLDLVLRTSVPPMSLAGAVRGEVEAMDPNLPLQDMRTLEQLVSESVSQPRFYMLLLSIFAGVALLLASIGIFGVISYSVARRTREIGVRMALGADARDVIRLVMGRALGLAGLGVLLGLFGALAATRLLSGLLFGVPATDPVTFGAVSAVLFGVAALASFLPAHRAIRVDPNEALRTE